MLIIRVFAIVSDIERFYLQIFLRTYICSLVIKLMRKPVTAKPICRIVPRTFDELHVVRDYDLQNIAYEMYI